MKAWEEKRRLELYHKKISQAKAVVKTGASSPSLARASKDFDLVPLEVLVKNFDLQPYRRKLKDEGFEGCTNRFVNLTNQEYSGLMERLKVLPGHRAKFGAMLDYLRTMAECTEADRPTPQRRVQSAVVGKRQPSQHLSSYSIMKSPVDLRIPQRYGTELASVDQESAFEEDEGQYSEDEPSLDEFEALELELFNAQKRTSARSQTAKPRYVEPKAEEVQADELPTVVVVGNRRLEMTGLDYGLGPTLSPGEIDNLAELQDSVDSRWTADPSDIVNTSSLPEEESKSLGADRIVPVKQPNKPPFSECSRPREGTGSSIDSWKIHATPSALDIEEMSHCLSEVICQHLNDPLQSRQSQLPQAFSDEFERVFTDHDSRGVPNANAIYNFCKNVMWRSQMEREIIVVCLVYLSRFLEKTGMQLKPSNWKRLAFIALTTSSKVWDDESFENQHFAQAFSLFSASEINAMESIFLTLLDYQLKVSSSEFTSFYLLLHSYSRPGMGSCGAAMIDVATLQRLEKLGDSVLSVKAQYGEALLKTM